VVDEKWAGLRVTIHLPLCICWKPGSSPSPRARVHARSLRSGALARAMVARAFA